jgi:hypothetical protein
MGTKSKKNETDGRADAGGVLCLGALDDGSRSSASLETARSVLDRGQLKRPGHRYHIRLPLAHIQLLL